MRRHAALLAVALCLAGCGRGTGPGGPLQAKIKAATVYIECTYDPIGVTEPADNERLTSSGSGFVIAREGLVITNAHVVASTTSVDLASGTAATDETPPDRRAVFVLHSVTVRTHSGTARSRVYDAQVLCTKPIPDDLALLRIRPEEQLTALEILPEEEFDRLDVGVPVQAWGFPLGMTMEIGLERSAELGKNPNGPDISMRPGVITSLRKSGESWIKAVEIDCPIEHGNSGGPLVDDRARVVGVIYLGMGKASRFAIPAHKLLSRFEHSLSWRRDEDEGGRRVKAQTLRAEADGSGDDLSTALEAAKPGDTVELSEGSHEWKAGVPFPPGVWVRGQGPERTTITGPVAWLYETKEMKARFAEMSDLTIEGRESREVEPLVLGIPGEYCYSEEYLHDVVIRRRHVRFDRGRGFIDIVNCTIEAGAGDRAGRVDIRPDEEYEVLAPRFERVRFELPGGFTSSAHPVVRIHGRSIAEFEGCLFVHGRNSRVGALLVSRDYSAVLLENSGRALLKGCRFQIEELSGSGTFHWIDTKGFCGKVTDCLFEINRGQRHVGIMLNRDSNVDISGNQFICANATPMAFAIGDPPYVQGLDFRYSYQLGHAIRSTRGHSSPVRRNLFYRSGIMRGSRRSLGFDVEIAWISMPGDNVYREAGR